MPCTRLASFELPALTFATMKTAQVILLMLAFHLCAFGQAAQSEKWKKYLPVKNNPFIKMLNDSSESGRSKGQRTGGMIVRAVWITDLVAREKVSRLIDRERISNDEAEQRFKESRSETEYQFTLRVHSDVSAEPINREAVFLQSAADRTKFVRAKVSGGDYLASSGIWNIYSYSLTFPKMTESNEPLVKSLEDVIEVSVTTSGEPVIIKFKIKDMVAHLEDL
jgi:hypothetical protein